MLITEVKTCAPFNELFEIKEVVVAGIAENMLAYGFDAAQPLVLWAGKDVVVDGHTRLEAARRAGLPHVYCCERMFRDEDDALAYAIHNQVKRRNLSEGELLRCIEALDKRKERGGDHGNQYTAGKLAKASNEAIGKTEPSKKRKDKSAQKTAEIVGTSRAKVERARAVLSDPEEKKAVLSGKKSINRAAREARSKRQPKAPEPESKPAVATPNREPIRLCVMLTPEPEGFGYTVGIKELPWVNSRGETLVDCLANLVGIFEEAGENVVLRQLISACASRPRLRSV